MARGKEKVGLVSLGCPKNLVDSEVMLGLLTKSGFTITHREEEADVLVVNTCAFIHDARKESLEEIRKAARLRKSGSVRKLIVTGCLPQLDHTGLEKEFPDVDHFLGAGEFHRIAEFAKKTARRPRSAVARPEFLYDHLTPRVLALPKHTAYVKIAEGCSRACSFCRIPKLRGRLRSRPIASVVTETETLARHGAVEIHLVAQDVNAYGRDLRDGTTLEGLLRELVRVEGIRWIRLMYNYPANFSDGLIDLIASSGKIAKYLDLPIQHIDDKILSSMRRGVGERDTRELLRKLRSRIPGLSLRTTLLVGFPGETEEKFEKLVEFVRETEFDHLGVFTYSKEEGTAAARLPGQVPAKTKKARRDRIMRLQQKISRKRNARLKGKIVDVLVDRACKGPRGYTHVGRTEGQALDIDGVVYVKGKSVNVGAILPVKITRTRPYDLFGLASRPRKMIS